MKRFFKLLVVEVFLVSHEVMFKLLAELGKKGGKDMKFRALFVLSLLNYMLVAMYDSIMYICYSYKSGVADFLLLTLIFPIWKISRLADREAKEKKRRK